MSGAPSELAITVIVPAYNAIAFLQRSLPPLLEMQNSGEILEVIVADDGSTDDTAHFAETMGARVLKNPKRGGPGAARNYGAPHAQGQILWFVDADVIVRPGTAHLIIETFKDDAVWALHGSYDDHPPAKNFMSQYKNLMHRFYHQTAREEASTFWSGCGAVRKERFLASGGFDVKKFTKPSVEDIDLGYRLKEMGGRLRLVKALECTHLKFWTLRNAIETDIFARAIPWSRLLVRRPSLTDDLNVSSAERLRAIIAGLFFLSCGLSPFVPNGWLLLIIATGLIYLANRNLFSFFLIRKGIFFSILSILYHQIYYIYSSCCFVYCVVEFKFFSRDVERFS